MIPIVEEPEKVFFLNARCKAVTTHPSSSTKTSVHFDAFSQRALIEKAEKSSDLRLENISEHLVD